MEKKRKKSAQKLVPDHYLVLVNSWKYYQRNQETLLN